jgi:hypothetical protein
VRRAAIWLCQVVINPPVTCLQGQETGDECFRSRCILVLLRLKKRWENGANRIDSQGQVLVQAPFEATANGYGVDTLLLTPGATAPEPLATPEPSTWLIWTLIGATALRLVNRRKGPSDSSRAGRADPPAPAV